MVHISRTHQLVHLVPKLLATQAHNKLLLCHLGLARLQLRCGVGKEVQVGTGAVLPIVVLAEKEDMLLAIYLSQQEVLFMYMLEDKDKVMPPVKLE